MTNTSLVYKCNWCSAPVDLSLTLAEFSDLALWGALEVLNTYGTLCDRCYDLQETVR